jgi:hypothetical protein
MLRFVQLKKKVKNMQRCKRTNASFGKTGLYILRKWRLQLLDGRRQDQKLTLVLYQHKNFGLYPLGEW